MIQITITDPTRDEALRLADYLFALAGYGKKDGIVGHKFETTPAQVDTQLKTHIESIAARTPVNQFIDEADTSGVVQTRIGDATAVVGEGYAPLTRNDDGTISTTGSTPPPPAAESHGCHGGEGATLPVDSAGHKWDERIHASSKAFVSDGTWRLRRNLDPAVLNAVLAERAANTLHGSAELDADAAKLNAVAGPGAAGATLNDVGSPPPAPGAWPFPSDVPPPPSTATGTDTGTTLAPVSVGVPPPPPPAAVPPAPATGLTFAAFMQRVTAAIGAGTIAQTDVAAALAAESVASIPMLASVHADKIDAVAARLGV